METTEEKKERWLADDKAKHIDYLNKKSTALSEVYQRIAANHPSDRWPAKSLGWSRYKAAINQMEFKDEQASRKERYRLDTLLNVALLLEIAVKNNPKAEIPDLEIMREEGNWLHYRVNADILKDWSRDIWGNYFRLSAYHFPDHPDAKQWKEKYESWFSYLKNLYLPSEACAETEMDRVSAEWKVADALTKSLMVAKDSAVSVWSTEKFNEWVKKNPPPEMEDADPSHYEETT